MHEAFGGSPAAFCTTPVGGTLGWQTVNVVVPAGTYTAATTLVTAVNTAFVAAVQARTDENKDSPRIAAATTSDGYCQADDDDASTASCACDVGFGGEHCDQHSGGAALPSILGGVGGGQAGAAVFGFVGMVGVATLVKRRVAAAAAGGGAGEGASGLLAPLATAV